MPSVGTPVGLPANVDLRIRQGSDVAWALAYRETDAKSGDTLPNDFTGWSARAQVRAQVGGAIWLTMTSDSGITLAVADNRLTLTGLIEHATTEDPAWNVGRDYGYWDVELVRADGTVIPLAAGRVVVEHDITRNA